MQPSLNKGNVDMVSQNLSFEPVHDKTKNLGLRPSPTQTRLYSHSIKLEARNFGYK